MQLLTSSVLNDKRLFEINNESFKICLTDTGENGTNWTVYFRLGAESYSSLGPVGKKEKKIAWDILAKFACGQVSSPRLHRLMTLLMLAIRKRWAKSKILKNSKLVNTDFYFNYANYSSKSFFK